MYSRYLLAAFLIIYGIAVVFGLQNPTVTIIGGVAAVGAGVLMLVGQ